MDAGILRWATSAGVRTEGFAQYMRPIPPRQEGETAEGELLASPPRPAGDELQPLGATVLPAGDGTGDAETRRGVGVDKRSDRACSGDSAPGEGSAGVASPGGASSSAGAAPTR